MAVASLPHSACKMPQILNSHRAAISWWPQLDPATVLWCVNVCVSWCLYLMLYFVLQGWSAIPITNQKRGSYTRLVHKNTGGTHNQCSQCALQQSHGDHNLTLQQPYDVSMFESAGVYISCCILFLHIWSSIPIKKGGSYTCLVLKNTGGTHNQCSQCALHRSVVETHQRNLMM